MAEYVIGIDLYQFAKNVIYQMREHLITRAEFWTSSVKCIENFVVIQPPRKDLISLVIASNTSGVQWLRSNIRLSI